MLFLGFAMMTLAIGWVPMGGNRYHPQIRNAIVAALAAEPPRVPQPEW